MRRPRDVFGKTLAQKVQKRAPVYSASVVTDPEFDPGAGLPAAKATPEDRPGISVLQAALPPTLNPLLRQKVELAF